MTKKIVTIGGGTGHYTLLKGLKNYDLIVDAIVSVFDNGGSTGKLREERVKSAILAPGDIRNCLLALTDDAKQADMISLFNHRFEENGSVNGHNLGNLILAAAQIQKGRAEGISIVSEMLGIKKQHRVIPVSTDVTQLYAETSSGKKLNGQVEVSYPQDNENISKIWLNPSAFIYREAAQALREADLIVICPGDLYGSVLPNFLVQGLKEAIPETTKIVYICNLVTKQGTYNYKVSDTVNEVEKYLGRKVDYIICNTKKPEKELVDKYRKEKSEFLEPDLSDKRTIKEDLLIEHSSGEKTIARHDSEKTARIIMSLIN